MKEIVLISSTFEHKEDAERIARKLLEHTLVACAQISGPTTSLYRWEGKIVSATEFSLILKTTIQCTEPVKAFLHREHPYDLPEILVQSIPHSSEEYSSWVYGEVQQ
ncbi:MAG: divalent-cation tolerance protein CutA [Desulforhopalus sp.]